MEMYTSNNAKPLPTCHIEMKEKSLECVVKLVQPTKWHSVKCLQMAYDPNPLFTMLHKSPSRRTYVVIRKTRVPNP